MQHTIDDQDMRLGQDLARHIFNMVENMHQHIKQLPPTR
jgi:hypothetical protein